MTAVFSIDDKIKAKKLLGALNTDIGNAERLLALYGEDLCYNVQQKTWFRWDGRRWRADEKLEIEQLAKAAMRSLYVASKDLPEKERTAMVSHAIKSERNSSIKAMIERARSEPGIPIATDDFDAQAMMLNCANGVVDLTTGDLKRHDRALLCTKLANVVYQETAPCPRWTAFLDKIFEGNDPLIRYLQRAIGYSLTGDTREQCMHLLHGTGSNGKTTFLETISLVMGDYAMQSDFSTFVEQQQQNSNAPKENVARLAGARMVRSSEVGEGKRFNEALIKSMTGEEVMQGRFLYSSTFTFMPTFKLWFAANHKPIIRGTDHGIWRRVRLIPFAVRIPDSEQDKGLREALKAELPGILAWAVQGCLEWRAGGLQPPKEVLAATDAYQAESDILGAFIEDCCAPDATAQTPSRDLYAAYRKWAKDGGEYELSLTAFGRQLEERGFTVHRTSTGKSRRGIRLREGAHVKPEELW